MKFSNLEFDKVLLTDNQLKAIHSNIYPQYIKASAGTGKTETLIQKILYVLETDAKSSLNNMIIISFTNKATDEIKSRISYELYRRSLIAYKSFKTELAEKLKRESYLVNISNISTIHRFCEKLLREYGLKVGFAPNYKISSYYREIDEIIENILHPIFKNNEINELPEATMKSLIFELYESNSNCGIQTIKDLSDEIPISLRNLKEKFIQAYNQFILELEKEKMNKNILSLNDLIPKSVDLLKDKHIQSQIRDKYQYAFIDEYQDTNSTQFDLTKELIKMNINVFLVGDERQAIYAFRGSDIENSKSMTMYINQVSNINISLLENFRSDPKIIKFINKVFSSGVDTCGFKLDFDSRPLLIPDINKHSEDNPVYLSKKDNIVDIIKELINEKTLLGIPIKYNDIAILCRKNYMVDEIGEILKAANIPVEVIGGRGFYKAKEIIDIYKVLNYLVYQSNEYKDELYLTDVYKSFVSYDCGNFDEFLEELSTVVKRSSVVSFIDYLIDNTKLEQYYIKTRRYQAISNLSKLRSMAFDNESSCFMPSFEFLEFISSKIYMESEEDEAAVSDDSRSNGVVSVYTIHKAKGLSFPVVIIANIDEPLINPKHFPRILLNTKNNFTELAFNNDILNDEYTDREYERLKQNHIIESLEEELRIFYVACTRAKHYLIFSSSQEKRKNSRYPNWASWVLSKHNFDEEGY